MRVSFARATKNVSVNLAAANVLVSCVPYKHDVMLLYLKLRIYTVGCIITVIRIIRMIRIIHNTQAPIRITEM